MAALVSALIALLCAVNAAHGLTCYKCDSSESTLCGWGIASFTYSTVNCEDSGFLQKMVPHQCAKFVGKTPDGKEYIARDCAPAIGDTICNSLVKAAKVFSSLDSNIEVSCSLCDGDKCNSASKQVGTVLLGLVLAIAAFVF